MKSIQLLLLLVTLLACNKEHRESEECIKLRDQAYKAALGNQLQNGKQLLEAAEAECGQASTYYLDRVRRVLERIERRDSQAERRAAGDDDSPLRDFVAWVDSLREAKDKAVGKHECAPRGSDQFGLCVSQVTTAEGSFELSYSREDPAALRFTYSGPEILACIDLGEHRDVSRWSRGGQRFEHCDLSSHALRGLSALISQEGGRSSVNVYSAEYKERVPAFRRQLDR